MLLSYFLMIVSVVLLLVSVAGAEVGGDGRLPVGGVVLVLLVLGVAAAALTETRDAVAPEGGFRN